MPIVVLGALGELCYAGAGHPYHAHRPALYPWRVTGGTDAGELARGGAQATCLVGMPWGNTRRSSVYHTPADVLSAVSPQAVAEAMALAIDLAHELDERV